MERFTGRIHQKLGIFDEIFPKIGKFAIIGVELGLKPNILGRKLRKIGFFAKTSNTLKSFALQLVAQVTIVENTKKKFAQTRDSTQYNKLVRNSHLLSQKSGISSSATTIAFQRA